MIPSNLYTAVQTRELDRLAIASGIDGYELMCRAGESAFTQLLRKWGLPENIAIVCGTGNNGGDGFVIARLARQRGLAVQVYLLGDKNKLQGEALSAYKDAIEAGVDISAFQDVAIPEKGIVVDALLGTGLRGELREDARQVIDWVNASTCPVLAVDIPSGLCSDTGCSLGAVVEADLTVTFIGAKQGLYTGSGRRYCGEILYDRLAVPEDVFRQVEAGVFHDILGQLLDKLPQRPADAHKGYYGHTLVIGGYYGFAGAVMMAAGAAARTGSGLVSVATLPEHAAPVIARYPEVMARGVVSGQELEPLLEKPGVIVIGPGLGQAPWSEQMMQKALATGLPMVIDADALNLLASHKTFKTSREGQWILTPHPGEAARLLGVSTAEIGKNRFAAARKLQQVYGGVIVLKGAGTIIATDEALYLCSAGNPGMATGGMGDILSGIIGGLLAQGLSLDVAARLGVNLHASAADLAAKQQGMRGMLATDLLAPMREILNG